MEFMEELDDISMSKVLRWTAATCIIFGGLAPYIPQYLEIKKTENSEGFSLYVCLALLMANTLRILFWFGKRYEMPLLLQSVLMNLAMLLLIRLCVRMRNRNLPSKERIFLDFDSKYFWRWTDFQSYVDFLLLFSVISSAVTYLLLNSVVYIELIGFLSVFIEAMLGMPQLVQNFKTKSTLGMSVAMVLMWTGGDIFKTIYFIVREAPAQFVICGFLQIAIDIVILLQVRRYGRGPTLLTSRRD